MVCVWFICQYVIRLAKENRQKLVSRFSISILDPSSKYVFLHPALLTSRSALMTFKSNGILALETRLTMFCPQEYKKVSLTHDHFNHLTL